MAESFPHLAEPCPHWPESFPHYAEACPHCPESFPHLAESCPHDRDASDGSDGGIKEILGTVQDTVFLTLINKFGKLSVHRFPATDEN